MIFKIKNKCVLFFERLSTLKNLGDLGNAPRARNRFALKQIRGSFSKGFCLASIML